MTPEINKRIEQVRRTAVVMASHVLGSSEEATAIRRMNAINSALQSPRGGYEDVFRFKRESGYKHVDVYALRLDASDDGVRAWLSNVAQGIDRSLSKRDQRGLIVHNLVLEEQCALLPINGAYYD